MTLEYRSGYPFHKQAQVNSHLNKAWRLLEREGISSLRLGLMAAMAGGFSPMQAQRWLMGKTGTQHARRSCFRKN